MFTRNRKFVLNTESNYITFGEFLQWLGRPDIVYFDIDNTTHVERRGDFTPIEKMKHVSHLYSPYQIGVLGTVAVLAFPNLDGLYELHSQLFGQKEKEDATGE